MAVCGQLQRWLCLRVLPLQRPVVIKQNFNRTTLRIQKGLADSRAR